MIQNWVLFVSSLFPKLDFLFRKKEEDEKMGMVQNTQMAQLVQMTQETQICSKRLKHADDGAADADYPSACFRCLKHADDRGAAQMLIFHMHHSPVVAFNLFSATLYPFWSPGS